MHKCLQVSSRLPPITVSDWKGILKTSHFLQSANSFDDAIIHLSDASLRPAEMLDLALGFQVSKWIRPSLLALIEGSPHELLDKDRAHLMAHNPTAYHHLILVKWDIIMIRHSLVILPPEPSHSLTCKLTSSSAQANCNHLWEEFWREATVYLIAAKHYSARAVAKIMQGLAADKFISMCVNNSIRHLMNSGALWKKEEERIEKGMQAILGDSFLLPATEEVGLEAGQAQNGESIDEDVQMTLAA
jgi:hypothetical protein